MIKLHAFSRNQSKFTCGGRGGWDRGTPVTHATATLRSTQILFFRSRPFVWLASVTAVLDSSTSVETDSTHARARIIFARGTREIETSGSRAGYVSQQGTVILRTGLIEYSLGPTGADPNMRPRHCSYISITSDISPATGAVVASGVSSTVGAGVGSVKRGTEGNNVGRLVGIHM